MREPRQVEAARAHLGRDGDPRAPVEESPHHINPFLTLLLVLLTPRPNRRKAVTLRRLRNLDRGFLASEPFYIVHGSIAALTQREVAAKTAEAPPRRFVQLERRFLV